MGLDWCVEARIREGKECKIPEREAEVERLAGLLEDSWTKFLADEGEEHHAHVFPNPTMDKWKELQETKDARGILREAQELLDQCYISPFETIGAPRIGIDDAATDWFVREARKQQAPQDIDTLLKENHGKFVPDLATNKGGHGSITGMLGSDISFRGKIIGQSVIVPGNLSAEAYADHTDEELLSYGHALMYAAEEYAIEHDIPWPLNKGASIKTEAEEDLKYLVDGANWCIFWGEHGHGMHAWY